MIHSVYPWRAWRFHSGWRRFFCVFSLVMFVPGSLALSAEIEQEVREELENFSYIRSIIVVDTSNPQFDTATTDEAVAQVATAINASLENGIRRIGRLPILAGDIDENSLEILEGFDGVSVQKSRLSKPFLADVPELIGLPTTSFEVNDISQAVTNSGYAVAVIDTGFDTDHPFFEGRILREACFSLSEYDNFEVSTLCPNNFERQTTHGAASVCPVEAKNCDHGTHVAGIISGIDEDRGIFGVSPNNPLILINVYTEIRDEVVCLNVGNTTAPCVLSFTDHQLEALEYVHSLSREHRIAAVNYSLGEILNGAEDCQEYILAPIIKELHSNGILTVAAAGNEGSTNVRAPACIEEVVAVAASDKQGEIATSFPAPATGGTNFSEEIDIVAPGVSIYSSVPGGDFAPKTGTSMAAPIVSGSIALVRQILGPSNGPPRGNSEIAERVLEIVSQGSSEPKFLDLGPTLNEATVLASSLESGLSTAAADITIANGFSPVNPTGGDMILFGSEQFSREDATQFQQWVQEHTGDADATVTRQGTGERLLLELGQPVDKAAIAEFSVENFGIGSRVFERSLIPGI